MSCDLTTSVSLDCRSNLGGVKTIYLATATGDDITLRYSGGTTNQNGAITGLTFGSTSVTGTTGLTLMYEFQQPRQSASLSETGTFSEENGVVFYTSVLSMVINKLQYANLNQLKILGQNTRIIAIVKDSNDKLFVVGNETGAIVTSSTAETGVAFGDRNGMTIELTGFSRDPLYELILS